MEPSSQGGWPWSSRDCIINHAFDLENIRTTWVMIKGDALIKDRIESATKYRSPAELSSLQTLDRAFASTLITHLIVVFWASENWDQFISFIESKFHEISRRTVSNEIDIPPMIVKEIRSDPSPRSNRTETGLSPRSVTSGSFCRPPARIDSFKSMFKKSRDLLTQQDDYMETGLNHFSLPAIKETVRVNFETRGQQGFSFGDLQALHHLHDKAKEAILILLLNKKIMSQLSQFYRTTVGSSQFPVAISRSCKDDLKSFESRIEEIKDDLHSYVMKLETLVEYIAECKTLVRALNMEMRGS